MRCASPREYYPMLAPPYPSDHKAGHQLAIGRNKMILLGRFLPITEAFPQQDLQTALGRSGLSLISTTIVLTFRSCLYQHRETDQRPRNLFILSTPRERPVVAYPKSTMSSNSTKKKCIASTRHKPLKNNIKPRPNLPYARDQSFAVNLFSSTFKAPSHPT